MKKFLRGLCFVLVFFLLLVFLGDLLRSKRFTEIAVENYHDEHSGLYELEDQTVDVLYIGSSHVFSSLSPEDIFKAHGITGYVQASSCQRVWQSYYYLQETYETQQPKVVVLDTFMALSGDAQSEAFNREAIDKMKLSPAKIASIRTAVEYNPDEEKFMSYFFPLLRFHDRWEELKEEDYVWFVTEQDAPAKGFLARIGTVPAEFNGNDYTDTEIEPAVMPENCREYLDKIKKMCEENGSQLVLTKFPTCLWNGASSAAIRQWSEENDVPFLDYCGDETLRNEVSIDWATESLDGGNHLNYAGAMKMTEVFGNYLAENYNFEDKREDPKYQLWHEDYAYYKRCVANYEMANTTDLIEYIKQLKTDDYVTFVSCNNLDLSTNEEVKKQLKTLGIPKKFVKNAANRNNLIVVQNGSSIYKEISEQDLVWKDTVSGTDWKISSKTQDGKQSFSCIADRTEYAKGTDAIQFVVFDTVSQKVIDSSYAMFDENGTLVLHR